MLQAFNPADKLVGSTETVSDSTPSVIPGWKLVNETVWRPCPIGVHYALKVPAASLGLTEEAKR